MIDISRWLLGSVRVIRELLGGSYYVQSGPHINEPVFIEDWDCLVTQTCFIVFLHEFHTSQITETHVNCEKS